MYHVCHFFYSETFFTLLKGHNFLQFCFRILKVHSFLLMSLSRLLPRSFGWVVLKLYKFFIYYFGTNFKPEQFIVCAECASFAFIILEEMSVHIYLH